MLLFFSDACGSSPRDELLWHQQEPPKEQEQEEPMETDTEPPKAEATPPQALIPEEDPSAEQRAKGTKFYQAGNWQVSV